MRDLRIRNGVGLPRDHFDLIARSYFSLPDDRHVETRPPAGQESLYHVVRPESHAQLVARQPRLRHHHFRRADAKSVAQMDGLFQSLPAGEGLPAWEARAAIINGEILS